MVPHYAMPPVEFCDWAHLATNPNFTRLISLRQWDALMSCPCRCLGTGRVMQQAKKRECKFHRTGPKDKWLLCVFMIDTQN